MIGQLPNMAPAWNVAIVTGLVVSLAACVAAAIVKRMVRTTYIAFAVIYLIALVSWPFSVLEESAAPKDSYWLYFLLTIATTMAAVALELPIAVVYTIGAPVLYGMIRMTPPGGGANPEAAILDSVYSIILGGVHPRSCSPCCARRRAASTRAQQTALERYSHAVRQHATEAERVQVDSIVHDSVLTTLLSAARAFTPGGQGARRDDGRQRHRVPSRRGGGRSRLRGNGAGRRGREPDRERGQHACRRSSRCACTRGARVSSLSTSRRPIYSAAVQAMINSLQHAGSGVDALGDVRGTGVRRSNR